MFSETQSIASPKLFRLLCRWSCKLFSLLLFLLSSSRISKTSTCDIPLRTSVLSLQHEDHTCHGLEVIINIDQTLQLNSSLFYQYSSLPNKLFRLLNGLAHAFCSYFCHEYDCLLCLCCFSDKPNYRIPWHLLFLNQRERRRIY